MFPFFPMFKACPDEMLPRLTLFMFHDLDMVARYKIPHDVLCHFVLSVAAGYRNNTYHNWRLDRLLPPLYPLPHDLNLSCVCAAMRSL